MIILNKTQYSKITDFIKDFKGLALECELELSKRFPEVPMAAIRSKFFVLSGNHLIKASISRHSGNRNNLQDNVIGPQTQKQRTQIPGNIRKDPSSEPFVRRQDNSENGHRQ